MRSPFREPPSKTDPATPLKFIIAVCVIGLLVIAAMIVLASV